MPKHIHAWEQNHLQTPRQMYAVLMHITFQVLFMQSEELWKLLISVAIFINIEISSIIYFITASPPVETTAPILYILAHRDSGFEIFMSCLCSFIFLPDFLFACIGHPPPFHFSQLYKKLQLPGADEMSLALRNKYYIFIL